MRQRLNLARFADVQELLHSAFQAAGRSSRIPVADAAGRVTAAPVYSPLTIPATDIAARDGFAVKSRETLGASGKNPVRLQNPKRVNTGNAISPGYDAVVMIEDVTGDEGGWSTVKAARPGEHIHPAGVEVRQGGLILPAGHWIRPCDIGVLLSCGVTEVEVLEIRVGLIPTGSEVVPAGEIPGPGGVIESNTAVAAAMLGEAGATCTRYGIVADDPGLLREAIERGILENDLLLVSAGSSAGTRDFTADVIGDLGEVLVHGIAMKPGKPAIVGKINGKPVIGIPGYPIAAVTAIRELALPLLAAWGLAPRPPQRISARLTETVTADPGYDEFVLLTVSWSGDHYTAAPLPRGSRTQMALVRANAFLHIPAGSGGVIPEGTVVEVEMTGPRV